jgi:hypothetical protein
LYLYVWIGVYISHVSKLANARKEAVRKKKTRTRARSLAS